MVLTPQCPQFPESHNIFVPSFGPLHLDFFLSFLFAPMFANGCIRQAEDGESARLAFLESCESDRLGTLAMAAAVYSSDRHLVTGNPDTRARASFLFSQTD